MFVKSYSKQNTPNPSDVWQPAVENQEPTHSIVTNCSTTKFLSARSARNPLYPVWKNPWRTSERLQQVNQRMVGHLSAPQKHFMFLTN